MLLNMVVLGVWVVITAFEHPHWQPSSSPPKQSRASWCLSEESYNFTQEASIHTVAR